MGCIANAILSFSGLHRAYFSCGLISEVQSCCSSAPHRSLFPGTYRSIPAWSLGAACQNLWLSQDITVQSRLANLPKESWANAQDAKPVGSCVGEESPLSPQSSQDTVE